ncbi:hypothetical protein [Okeania sp. KiyG1]|uniref:hypothetical protein n=1 Tax=Okeania sp. KiyG1 TaxID=2720165 RepID=UPI001923F92B|nr:hypothetical protein [Okeania sp. KiyG1]GGA19060.1 hypothetical protein CYANOKiyG1_33650 [Okeania sp. KiyG1]
MTYDPKQLFISDDFIIELMGWKEVKFLTPPIRGFGSSSGLTFGTIFNIEQKSKLRANGLKLLRKGPSFLERLSGLNYYNSFLWTGFMNRSTKKIPLASSALRHLVLEADKFNNNVNNVIVLDKLKSGRTEAFKEAIDHPVANILIAACLGWIEP